MSLDGRLGSGWLQLRLGGVLIPADRVGPVSIAHGRVDIDRPADPGTCTVTVDRTALVELPSIGTELTVQLSDQALTELGCTPGQAVLARTRFVGDLTDARLAPRTAAGQALLTLTAVAPAARLNRVRIGVPPWPEQPDGARAQAILNAAAALVPLTVDTVDPGTVSVLGRDVDAAHPGELLAELASDSGGQLHLARDGALSWHDQLHRRNAAPVVELTDVNVMRDTGWLLDLQGVVNDVTVAYGVPPVDAEGNQGEQPQTRVVDGPSATRYGRLAARLGTQLATEADAVERARQLVGRRSRPRWRLPALRVELLRTLTRAQSAALLTVEPADLIAVAGFPDVGPEVTARLFVEGWTENADRYGYGMALSVVSYSLAGASPRWVDVNTTTRWSAVPPDMTWLQALAWHTESDLRRWLDVPNSRRWLDVDPAMTWQTWQTYPTP